MVAPTIQRPNQEIYRIEGSYYADYMFRVRWIQKFPVDRPLYYHAKRGHLRAKGYNGLAMLGTPTKDAAQICNLAWYNQSLDTQTINLAYERFKNRIYDSAQFGVDFAEYRQALGMVERSAATLWRFTKQIKGLNFLGAASTLRMHLQPKGVSARKSWSNNWLEYHFGWEPLFKDIHDGLEILHNPIKTFTSAKGRAFNFDRFHIADHQPTSAVWTDDDVIVYYQCQQGGAVEAIADYGLHSLDQYGVLNPLSIAWELVPFSFVVDWFANVGQVLGSLSDFAGMTLKNTFWGRKIITVDNGRNDYRPGYTGPRTLQPNSWTAFGVWTDRNLGLSSPSFNVKKLTLPSATRAVTAVSLLTQQLSRK